MKKHVFEAFSSLQNEKHVFKAFSYLQNKKHVFQQFFSSCLKIKSMFLKRFSI